MQTEDIGRGPRRPLGSDIRVDAKRTSARHLPRTLGAIAFGGLIVVTSGLARSEDAPPPFDGDRAREVAAAMDEDPSLARKWVACPADIYLEDASFWGRWFNGREGRDPVSTPQCEARPKQCYEMCMASGRPEYCLRLALAFQLHEDQISPRFAQMMFARSCALGGSGGCTNRAAHIRNLDDEDNAARIADPGARDLCEFRSFKIDCDNNGAWGCAMLGQAYRLGEGVSANAAAARSYYQRSCELAPNFAACDFARDALKEMSSQ